MRPKVIMFNTVSLDGALRDFEIDLGLHYRIAGQYGAGAHLIGSETARSGIELFSGDVPPEKASDRVRPLIEPEDERPLWAVVDSRGILMNLLHTFRRSEFGRDVIVFISESTSDFYRDYLEERQYPFHVTGEARVDLRKALEILAENYKEKIVLTDGGAALNGILLEKGLVDEIGLLVSPFLVGKGTLRLFEKLDLPGGGIKLNFVGREVFEKGHILLKYEVEK